ncbi:MAG: serine hydroxymethyltransferase [Candidatus Harrisonbacteria bacterium CG10_big_fil_rev_8_21_14_0_10_44_23]|uniref:Serine hydroxymethyltransferase n=1 Tax=Candidatus Harrisonbacteria bacterium CG10_big_fil_rev_8_21_14_0_10_44_23 TaxID=1974585 RepID=A0A2H0USX9_9BACT|nr:MAG: serine hydroxymethyltransferase [Candidatus Harrisonbacteria bacterium CG10_big_fil_rev_8_21_14_0_10_44_23]
MSKKLSELIKKEIKRQKETIDLIPSENIIEPDILKILGSPLANKYSEGYPGKRYYPGNKYYDEIELYAQEQGLKAFGLKKGWFCNVQPYSGSPANMAIYFALANPGDTVMGMILSHGGHLTHGHKVNFSGTYYDPVQYGVDLSTGKIDYDAIEVLARENVPRLIYSGTTSYTRAINFKRIGQIAKSIGAFHVADISHIAGLVAAGEHPSPFPHADVVMATTHKTMRGPRGAVIFTKGEELAKKIDKAVMPGLQGGPHNNQTAAIAAMFEKMQAPKFKRAQKQIVINARALSDELKRSGFDVVSNGTDIHMLLLDLKRNDISGIDAEKLLESAGILANRNSVPGDIKPFHPCGVRMGTPSATNRGMKVKEMKKIAGFIKRLIIDKESPKKINKEVVALCKKFPLPY